MRLCGTAARKQHQRTRLRRRSALHLHCRRSTYSRRPFCLPHCARADPGANAKNDDALRMPSAGPRSPLLAQGSEQHKGGEAQAELTNNVRHERRQKGAAFLTSARWRGYASPPRRTACHSCCLLRRRSALHGACSSCSRFSRRTRCVHKPHGDALRLTLTLTLACLLRAAHADAAAGEQPRGLCCGVHRACDAGAVAVALPKQGRWLDDRCRSHDAPVAAMRQQREQPQQRQQPMRAMPAPHRCSAGYALHRASLPRREA
jgi:hypothetical protein